jgi:hypothetical protein
MGARIFGGGAEAQKLAEGTAQQLLLKLQILQLLTFYKTLLLYNQVN